MVLGILGEEKRMRSEREASGQLLIVEGEMYGF